MCRANLSYSFDREGVSYLNVLSNDANRHSNLNSKIRFNTGYVLIFIQEKSKLEQLEIQTQKDNCFLDRTKKKERKKYCLNLFYKFIEFCFILLAKRFQKLKVLLAANYSFLAPQAMHWTLICLDLFKSWLITIKWRFILMRRFYSCSNLTQCNSLTQKLLKNVT